MYMTLIFIFLGFLKNETLTTCTALLIKHFFRIFEDTSAPFSGENVNNKKESLGNSLV